MDTIPNNSPIIFLRLGISAQMKIDKIIGIIKDKFNIIVEVFNLPYFKDLRKIITVKEVKKKPLMKPILIKIGSLLMFFVNRE